MKHPPQIRNELETIGKGKFLELVKDGQWEYCRRTHSTDVVFIIPLLEHLDENCLILISEYRPAIGKDVVGFPAGLVGDVRDGETELEAAHTELIEETGYKAGKMTFLTKGPPSAGMSNEIISFYLATELELVGSPEKGIVPVLISYDNIQERLDEIELDGKSMIDPKTFIGLYFVEQYLFCLAEKRG